MKTTLEIITLNKVKLAKNFWYLRPRKECFSFLYLSPEGVYGYQVYATK